MQKAPLWLLVLVCALGTARTAPSQDPTQVPRGYILVDDMILPEEAVLTESAFAANPWPLGVVAYNFNANVSAANITQALKAMAEVSAVCGTIFVPLNGHQNWITFNASTVNNSFVGMQGGGQTINITSWGTKFIIVHEIMHALGYVHEQCRPDRDSFVAINWGNIQAGQGNNFQIVNGATQATAYDFLSIMHYSRAAFSSNSQDTITCHPAFSGFQNQIGNRTFMTLADAQGLQARYGASLTSPSFSHIIPTSTTTSSGTFTLHVYGNNFFEGSPDGNGVQGTKIRWNGTVIPTTYIDSQHLTAQVTPSMISQPQNVQITVYNPAPGSGWVSSAGTLSVTCGGGNLALANGVPTTTFNGCQQFSISPSYGVFNVVGVSGTSDWDLQMGSSTAAAGGGTCDFLAGSGYFGNGTVSPANGNLIHYSGTTSGTIQHVTSTEVRNGQPTIASMSAGSVVRAFHFYSAAVSYRMIQVAGPTNLNWKLVWEGNSFNWRSSTTNVVAQGTVGAGPVTGIGVVSGNYCLVVYSNNGPTTTSADLTITMCFDFTPTPLSSSNNIVTMNHGPYSCVPFSISPLNGYWNVVGVSSPTDWDIQIGTAVSQGGGNTCDYVLANGNLGTVTPVTGVTSPYSIPGSPGELQFAPTATMPTAPSSWYSYTYMLLCFEVYVATPGNYDVTVSASGYNWDFHFPGANAAWRAATSRAAGPFPADGAARTINNLPAGWHCVVVYHNGGSTSLVSPGISIGYSSIQQPTLASIAPDVVPAGGPAFTLTAHGSAFVPTSTLRWNGSSLPTSYVSATQLTATVGAALIATSGSASIDVATPGGGNSAIRTLTIGNPVPSLTSLSLTQIIAGSPTTSLTITGTGFVPGAQARWQGQPIGTTWSSPTQVVADLDASLLLVPGSFGISVSNPAPGGGESSSLPFAVLAPIVASLFPATIPVQAPGALPIAITVGGSRFAPWSVAHANGTLLPSTYVGPGTMTVTLNPNLFVQSAAPGALAITISNSAEAVSNMRPLVVVGGTNSGMIRTHPLGPLPATPFSVFSEAPFGPTPMTLIVDLGMPTPIRPWPDPATNLVLGVTELAGSAGPWVPLLDGIGLFGPGDGTTYGPGGTFNLPGLVMPNPPAQIPITVQAVYVDAAAPLGLRLTWPFHRFDL